VVVKFGVPIATITVPAEGGTTTRTSDFSGSTTALGDSIELWRGNTLLAKDIRITNGTWMAKDIKLDAGLNQKVDVFVRQDNQSSERTTRTVTVVPNKVKIDSPKGTQNMGSLMRVSGVGAVSGDKIVLQRRGGHAYDFPPVEVDDYGHWTTNQAHNLVQDQTLAAVARAGVGLYSAPSDAITPTLLYTTAPHFTEPQAGDRTGTKPICKGLARAGSTVTVAQWFNGASVLATTVADADGRWEVQSTVALPAGANWMQARDTLAGQHSEWRRSECFQVTSAVADFTPPIVDFPKPGEEVGLKTAFSGRGLAGAEVHVYKKGVGSVPLATFTVGRNGRWSGSLNQPLPIGDYTFSVNQERDSVKSGWLMPDRTVKIVQLPAGFAKPAITSPESNSGKILESNPEITGTGLAGSTLYVYRDNSVNIVAQTHVQANGQWKTRCTNNLALGDRKLAAQQHRDGSVSAGSGILIHIKIGTDPLPPLITNILPEDDVPHNLVLEGKAMPGARVNLYKHGIPTVIGTGIADKDGVWTIKLYNLPLGEFIFNGKTVHGTVASGWMALFKVYIHNFG
uniref:hypothetical protein n=1 Tax=Pseudomonas sp. TWP3-1 TaxID=2804631 RepID=UPI003CE92076